MCWLVSGRQTRRHRMHWLLSAIREVNTRLQTPGNCSTTPPAALLHTVLPAACEGRPRATPAPNHTDTMLLRQARTALGRLARAEGPQLVRGGGAIGVAACGSSGPLAHPSSTHPAVDQDQRGFRRAGPPPVQVGADSSPAQRLRP